MLYTGSKPDKIPIGLCIEDNFLKQLFRCRNYLLGYTQVQSNLEYVLKFVKYAKDSLYCTYIYHPFNSLLCSY